MSPASAAKAPARPQPATRRPRAGAAPARRVSGPAPRARVTAPRRPARDTGRIRLEHVPARLLASAKALPRHRALDRLIRGRSWIGLVAFALIGIVTLQLGLLQLNASVGRALERETVLERENSALSVENSSLASPERIEALATRAGMHVAPESSLRFLGASATGVLARALHALALPAGSDTSASTTTATTAATTAATTEAQPPAQTAEGEGTAGAGASGTVAATGSSQQAPPASGGEGTEGVPATAPTTTSTQTSASAGGGEQAPVPNGSTAGASGGAAAGSQATEGAG